MSVRPRTAASALTMRRNSVKTRRSWAAPTSPLACARTAAAVSGSISNPQLGRQARDAQRAQGIGGDFVGADHLQALVVEIAGTTVGIDEPEFAAQRLGHRVDRQVARGEVGLQVLPCSGVMSTCELRSRRHHARRAELVDSSEPGAPGATAPQAARAARRSTSPSTTTSRSGVGRPSRRSRSAPPHEPRALPRPAPRAASRSRRHSIQRPRSRGTRAVSEHGTS